MKTNPLKLFPAIDLLNGKLVRLVRGDFDQVTDYGLDPVETAVDFRRQGAEFLHVVDLDGARDGEAANHRLIEQMVKRSGLRVQVGGGIRNMERIAAYLDAGAMRVILGSAAVNDPSFLREALDAFGEQVAVGVDMMQGEVMTHGWEVGSGVEGLRFCKELMEMGVKTLIVTDIEKDGELKGTNLSLYENLSKLPVDVVASGGITQLEELEALQQMGLYGAIVGKAFYVGRFTLKDALQILENRRED